MRRDGAYRKASASTRSPPIVNCLSVYRLRTFGSIAIERDGLPLAGRATQRRRLALLALLASAGPRGVRRDKLLAYLWPESDAEQGRHSLSQTLYSLRQELGSTNLWPSTSCPVLLS